MMGPAKGDQAAGGVADALMSVLDDFATADDAANAAYISSVITAYVRSSALVLCGKDVAIPFFVSWEFESNRMRKIVKKLGGTQLAYA